MDENRGNLTVIRGNDDKTIYEELENVDSNSVLDEEVLYKVFKIGDELTRIKVIANLEAKAKSVGQYRNFQKMMKIVKAKSMTPTSQKEQNFSVMVEELGLVLSTGDWVVDKLGVRRYVEKGEQLLEEQASWQFIVVSNIYYNEESNTYKVQLAFRESDSSKLKTITVNKSVISSTSNITCLSDYGISVTNLSAPFLVKYLNDLERLNVDIIPKSSSISRLGWIDNYGFIPYTDDISFDGETVYGELYNAIDCKGSYEEWKKMVLNEQSIQAKMALATSFASPLVKILDGLCFFTHFWGDSGTGKSVSLHLAESVWGNPVKLVQNLNSTAVGSERLAGFFCNLPLCLDELQTLKKSYGKNSYDETLYKLGQGKGKNRGKKDGSIEKVPTWSMAFITTGEEPITNENSGAGAKNRVVDVYCNKNIFTNAPNVARVSHQNYGWAGREFIEKLVDFIERKSVEPISDLYEDFYKFLQGSKVTDKQAMSATMIAMGYVLMKHFIFNEDFDHLKLIGYDFLDEIKNMLVTVDEINNCEEIYQDLQAFILQNKHHFIYKTASGIDYNPIDERLETWGKIVGYNTYITSNVFREFCDGRLISFKKITRSLAENNLLMLGPDKLPTITTRINSGTARCVCIVSRDLSKNDNKQIEMEEVDLKVNVFE